MWFESFVATAVITLTSILEIDRTNELFRVAHVIPETKQRARACLRIATNSYYAVTACSAIGYLIASWLSTEATMRMISDLNAIKGVAITCTAVGVVRLIQLNRLQYQLDTTVDV